MTEIDIAADELLAELGIISGSDSSSSAPPPPPPPAPAGGAPAPPPPPPPPPPPASSGGFKASSKAKKNAQDDINDVFDSVISFAGKTSAKKSGKVPPPVAPKPKRKIHVSSYTMKVKSPTSKDAPKNVAVPAAAVAPAPPRPPPPKEEEESKKRIPSEGGIVPKSDAPPTPPPPSSSAVPPPVPMVAFGPGLETFEVNCFGDFQVSCPHDITVEDLEVTVKGPTGTKPVEIDEHGNGQFSCSYLPTMAGDHLVSIKVEDEHIPGSPFTAHVQFAQYTDKCKAEGPGLVSGTTTEPCHFTIKAKTDAGYARMRIHVVGPSKAEPIEMVEDKNCVNVTYHPSAPGDYTIRVLWGDANVHGSPFTVPVSGDYVNDASKVRVTGEGLKGGNVNEPIKLFVEGEAGAGPGPLGVRMVGPSKPSIIADDSSEEGVELTILCQDPGEYQLILKWGTDEVPSSPYTIKVEGEGRQIRPDLCSASGSGISSGVVGDSVKFTVDIPDNAGPGSLGVSVAGPHPPKPIEIVNNQDGTMEVTYHPIAPGDYKIDILWANEHISGSPFTAAITGMAVRNPREVNASGDILDSGEMKCNQLGTINVVPKTSAGAGPLRAKLEGPSKAELELAANPDGTMLVSFIPKEAGEYKLHLLWGDGEDDESEINGSPFLIKVSN